MPDRMMLNLADCVITTGVTDIGLRFIALWSTAHRAALGVVYGVEATDRRNRCRTFIVHGSFVHPSYRRCGIRSMINDAIFANLGVELIRSDSGTAEGGADFMTRTGYKRDAQGGWYITREVWQQRRAGR
ncbi:MAG: hypothetical protein HRU71_12965 [Planctomycetia bacterium]|nr:MAG: hypothetical protein HRU71_12965 [Planctomycetia bacterium]